jgi:hypothetical protein
MNYPLVDNSATNAAEPAGERDLDLAGTRYAEELRAVGQALEAQSRFVSAEIEAQGNGYWVRAAVEESKNAGESFAAILKRTFRSLVQSDKHTISPTIELRYSAEETEKLVHDGQARRHDTNAAPDPFSLSHTLRTAGAYVDGLGQATLIGIAVKDCEITIRYQNASGQIKELKQEIQFFYDYWVKMYLRRKNRSAPMPSPTNPTYKTALKER